MSKSLEEIVLACDFETYQWENEKKESVSNVVAFSCKEVFKQEQNRKIEVKQIQEIKNQVFYFDSTNLDQTVMNKFFEYLFNFKEYSKVNIFFHNLKNFDGFFLVPHLLDNFRQVFLESYELENGEFILLYVNGQMLNVRVKKDNVLYNIIDSLAFFPQTSLKQLGQIIDLPKLEFNHDFDITIEKPKNSERYLTFVEYTKRDVEVLAKFLLYYTQKTKINLLNRISAAGISFQFFEEKYKRPGMYLSSEEDWYLIKESYFGGFTYLNTKYKLNVYDKLNYFDINSAYPYVLQDYLPYGDLEIYENQKGGTKLLKIQINKLEISELDIGTIRSTKNNERFIKNSDNPFIYYIWDFELVWVKKFYKVFDFEIIETFWIQLKKIAKEFIDHWYSVKQKNAAKATPEQKLLNFQSKIFLNSFYGKFGENLIKPQRMYVEKEKVKNKPNHITLDNKLYHVETIHEQKSYKNFVEVTLLPENPKIKKIKNIAIASYVTAKVRILLYQQILKHKDSFVYCDTDSIVLKNDNLDSYYISNEKLGLWKYEYQNVKGYFIKPKCYCLLDPKNGKIIFKSAGFQKILTELVFENIRHTYIYSQKLSSKKSATGVVLVPQMSRLLGDKWEKITNQITKIDLELLESLENLLLTK